MQEEKRCAKSWWADGLARLGKSEEVTPGRAGNRLAPHFCTANSHRREDTNEMCFSRGGSQHSSEAGAGKKPTPRPRNRLHSVLDFHRKSREAENSP